MTVFFLDWVLWSSWYVVLMLICTVNVMRISIRWRVRLNSARCLLAKLFLESTVIRMRRKIILILMLSTIKLLTSFCRELTLMEIVTWNHLWRMCLLCCLIIHGNSRRSILCGRPSLTWAWCILVWVAISTISFHKFWSISILRNRLKLTQLYLSFILVHPVWVGTIKILSLGRRIAANVVHVAILVWYELVLLMEVWSRLEFDSTLGLVYIFLRILPNLFWDVSWRLFICI